MLEIRRPQTVPLLQPCDFHFQRMNVPNNLFARYGGKLPHASIRNKPSQSAAVGMFRIVAKPARKFGKSRPGSRRQPIV